MIKIIKANTNWTMIRNIAEIKNFLWRKNNSVTFRFVQDNDFLIINLSDIMIIQLINSAGFE